MEVFAVREACVVGLRGSRPRDRAPGPWGRRQTLFVQHGHSTFVFQTERCSPTAKYRVRQPVRKISAVCSERAGWCSKKDIHGSGAGGRGCEREGRASGNITEEWGGV